MFEWDPAKNAANRKKHGISFEEAIEIFDGPVLSRPHDDSRGERRWRGEFVPPWDWRRGGRLKSDTRVVPRASAGDPRDCNIKGNVSYSSGKRIYHMPGDRDYERTRIGTWRDERYFCTEAEYRELA